MGEACGPATNARVDVGQLRHDRGEQGCVWLAGDLWRVGGVPGFARVERAGVADAGGVEVGPALGLAAAEVAGRAFAALGLALEVCGRAFEGGGALGLLAGGVALATLSSFGEVPLVILAIAGLASLGGVALGVWALVSWRRTERALRRGQPLPAPSVLPWLVAGVVVVGLLLAGVTAFQAIELTR